MTDTIYPEPVIAKFERLDSHASEPQDTLLELFLDDEADRSCETSLSKTAAVSGEDVTSSSQSDG